HRPEALRIAVVVRDEPAHDRIADVQDDRGPRERAEVEVGRDESESRPVGKEDGRRHAPSFRRASLILESPSLYSDASHPLASHRGDTVISRLCSLGGEAFGTLAASLFASPRFADAAARAVRGSLVNPPVKFGQLLAASARRRRTT